MAEGSARFATAVPRRMQGFTLKNFQLNYQGEPTPGKSHVGRIPEVDTSGYAGLLFVNPKI